MPIETHQNSMLASELDLHVVSQHFVDADEEI